MQKYKILDFDSIRVGDQRELSHKITKEDIQKFSDLTGDHNPLHLDREFARQTYLRKPVVYGMLSASFVSTVVGTLMPGPGALWISQTLDFLRQVYEGDIIRVVVRVKKKSPATRILVLETIIYKQPNLEVIIGEAKVRLMDLGKEGDSMKVDETMVVLVTGASRGIGAAISRKLASSGHKVVINYLKSKVEALKLVDQIKASGSDAIAVGADISDKKQVRAMFTEINKALGPVGGLVHNASIPIILKSFEEMRWQEVQQYLDVQAKGAFLCMKEALPGMIKVGGGSVVMIGSIVTDSVPPKDQTGYVMAKSALVALAKSLAVECGPKGIRVNVISPGMTKTDMIADFPQKVKELTRMQIPLRRLAEVQDISGVVSFLLSPAARHITGANIRVCGGSTMV